MKHSTRCEEWYNDQIINTERSEEICKCSGTLSEASLSKLLIYISKKEKLG